MAVKIQATAGSSTADEATRIPDLTYWQVFVRFLRFGFLAFGGPVAQIAMLRRELVDEEHWVSSSRFNRILAIYQVLPGPEAHEMCVFFGMIPKGRLGGFLAGLGFMLPGFVLMFALSWLYLQTNLTQTIVAAAFLGVQPAVIALIARAVHRIGSHVLLNKWLWSIAVAAALAELGGTPFWISLPLAGAAFAFAERKASSVAGLLVAALVAIGLFFAWTTHGIAAPAPSPPATDLDPHKPSLLALFVSGLKAGMLTFGGAYTVIPFLRSDAVGSGWMTDTQFLDGLALSGILPAPLIIFSTFVGYFGGGPLGAVAMTIGIFLPAFAFGILFHDHLERLVDNELARSFLEGIAAGVVGLIAATTVELGYRTLVGGPGLLIPIAIFLAALASQYVFKAKTTVLWVVLVSAMAGLALYR